MMEGGGVGGDCARFDNERERVMVLLKVIAVKSIAWPLQVTCTVRKESLDDAYNEKFLAGFVVGPCIQWGQRVWAWRQKQKPPTSPNYLIGLFINEGVLKALGILYILTLQECFIFFVILVKTHVFVRATQFDVWKCLRVIIITRIRKFSDFVFWDVHRIQINDKPYQFISNPIY